MGIAFRKPLPLSSLLLSAEMHLFVMFCCKKQKLIPSLYKPLKEKKHVLHLTQFNISLHSKFYLTLHVRVNHIFSIFCVKTNAFCTVLYLELFGKLQVDMLWSYRSLQKKLNLCHKKDLCCFGLIKHSLYLLHLVQIINSEN